jgi:hypothetical protein
MLVRFIDGVVGESSEGGATTTYRRGDDGPEIGSDDADLGRTIRRSRRPGEVDLLVSPCMAPPPATNVALPSGAPRHFRMHLL